MRGTGERQWINEQRKRRNIMETQKREQKNSNCLGTANQQWNIILTSIFLSATGCILVSSIFLYFSTFSAKKSYLDLHIYIYQYLFLYIHILRLGWSGPGHILSVGADKVTRRVVLHHHNVTTYKRDRHQDKFVKIICLKN